MAGIEKGQQANLRIEGLEDELLEPPRDVEIIAVGRSIRRIPSLRQKYGEGRWRKLKGIARVRTEGGRIRPRSIGTRPMESRRKAGKVKRYLD